MLCFGFINPQVIRLMLDRSRFAPFIVPAIDRNFKKTIEFYEASIKSKAKQTPVFVFPNFETLTAIVKSGIFDQRAKYITCAAASKLEEHGLDIFDGTYKGAVWQLKMTMAANLNAALIKTNGIDDEIIALVTKRISRPEEQFSNPKNVEPRCTDIKQAFNLLGDRRSEQGEAALVKFLCYGFVASELAKLADSADEIVAIAKKRYASKNAKAFMEYVKAKRIPMTKEAASYVKAMQLTSIPRCAIAYAWKTMVSNRPSSLAAAETGIDPALSGAITRRLSIKDIPTPTYVKRNPETVVAHNANCTIIKLKRGYHEMMKLITAAGFKGQNDTDILAQSSHPVKFNLHPRWKDNKNWWPVGIDAKPLLMLFNNRKFRFEAF